MQAGIEIVGAAFEWLNPETPPGQNPQKGKRQGCLAGPARRSGNKKGLMHCSHHDLKYLRKTALL